jgi:hypothetical protein
MRTTAASLLCPPNQYTLANLLELDHLCAAQYAPGAQNGMIRTAAQRGFVYNPNEGLRNLVGRDNEKMLGFGVGGIVETLSVATEIP